MIKDLTKSVQIIEEQVLQIIQTDASMNIIYQTFDQKTNEEQEVALEEYINLLNKRFTLTQPLHQVELYLQSIISGLHKHELNFWDKREHKRRIKDMKRKVELTVSFEDDETDKVESKLTMNPYVDKTVIQEVKQEQSKNINVMTEKGKQPK